MGTPPVEAYRTYRPSPFTNEERDSTTILFGACTGVSSA